MFHSLFTLRRTLAQLFATFLLFAATAHLNLAHAQYQPVVPFGEVRSTDFRMGTITGTRIIGNPPVIGDIAQFSWVNPYDRADFTVNVDVTSGVTIDNVQVRGPDYVEMHSQNPNLHHAF